MANPKRSSAAFWGSGNVAERKLAEIPVCRKHALESLWTQIFNLRIVSSSFSSIIPPYLRFQHSTVICTFRQDSHCSPCNTGSNAHIWMVDWGLLQRMSSKVFGCTCMILSPEKLIRELMVLSLRNFIVVRSLSVQVDSSISVKYEGMRGKMYSAKACSAAALRILYKGSLITMQG